MVKFAMSLLRLEATERALARGERITGRILLDDLRFVDEPPVPASQVEALHAFLKTAPNSHDRRRVADRKEGARLLAVIDAHQDGGSLPPAALEALRGYLRGDSAKPHRPLQRPGATDKATFDNMAADIAAIVREALAKSEAVELPYVGRITEPETNKKMPLGERVMLLTHQILGNDLGYHPPSVPTLRNRLSRRNARIRDFVVNARAKK